MVFLEDELALLCHSQYITGLKTLSFIKNNKTIYHPVKLVKVTGLCQVAMGFSPTRFGELGRRVERCGGSVAAVLPFQASMGRRQ